MCKIRFPSLVIPFVTILTFVASLNVQAEMKAARISTAGGDYSIEVDSSGIRAKSLKEGKVLFSTSKLARENFGIHAKEEASDCDLSYDEDYEVLSVVGPFLNLKYHMYSSLLLNGVIASAHPSGETRYMAIDLRRPDQLSKRLYGLYLGEKLDQKQMLKLTDIFPEKEVLRALLADRVVKESLQQRTEVNIKTVADLVQTLDERYLPEPLCGEFDSGFLNSFAFHHIEGSKVAVRIGISGCGPCRENLTDIGILLPIPSAWRTAFALANEGKEGFLQRSPTKKALRAVSYHFAHKLK